MNYNLLFDNNLNFYYILIGSGIILSCSLYYLFKNNNTENLNNINTEIKNNQDIIDLSDEIVDAIAESASEADIASDYQYSLDSLSDMEIDTTELDLFFMPNIDPEIVSIHELKHFEISSLYREELEASYITDEELEEILGIFSVEDLCTNDINESILLIITNLIM
jgi:hypothetical protein